MIANSGGFMGKEIRFAIHGDGAGGESNKVNSLKQHINLSVSANQIIDEDSKTFSNGEDLTFGGLLNRIFMNFYERADASIS
jgi:hypothetical protein